MYNDIFTKTYLKIITESEQIRDKVEEVESNIKKAEHLNKDQASDDAIATAVGEKNFADIDKKLTDINKKLAKATLPADIDQNYNIATLFAGYLKYGGYKENQDLDQQINNRLVSNAEKYKQGWTQYLESNLPLKNYLDTPVKGSKVTRADYLRAIYKENDNFFQDINNVNKLLNMINLAATGQDKKFELIASDPLQRLLFNYAPNTIPATGRGEIYFIIKNGLLFDAYKHTDVRDPKTDISYEVKNILGSTRAAIHCELDQIENPKTRQRYYRFRNLDLQSEEKSIDKIHYLLYTDSGIKDIAALDLQNMLLGYVKCKIVSKNEKTIFNFYYIENPNALILDSNGFVTNLKEVLEMNKAKNKPIFHWSTQSHGGIEIYSKMINNLFK